MEVSAMDRTEPQTGNLYAREKQVWKITRYPALEFLTKIIVGQNQILWLTVSDKNEYALMGHNRDGRILGGALSIQKLLFAAWGDKYL